MTNRTAGSLDQLVGAAALARLVIISLIALFLSTSTPGIAGPGRGP